KTRAPDAGDLIAVRRQRQIQRKDFVLRQMPLEPPGEPRFLQLLAETAATLPAGLPVQEETRNLLGDRRAALASSPDVRPRRAPDGHRVDAVMPAKAVILGRQRSGNDVRRQRRGVYRIAVESVTAARFVQQLAVTV